MPPMELSLSKINDTGFTSMSLLYVPEVPQETACTGCTGLITNAFVRGKLLLTVGIFRICYYDAYVVVHY